MDFEVFRRAAIREQNEIVVCPFNKSHQIRKSKIQYHIAKCQKQNGDQELHPCPYNATHRFPKPGLPYHISECPDRGIVEKDKYQLQGDCEGSISGFPGYVPPKLPSSEENWNETLDATYHPEQFVKNKPVLRSAQGKTKSERKLFRQEERRRVIQLSCGNPGPVASTSRVEQVRLPRSLPPALKSLIMSSKLGMGRGAVANDTEEIRGFDTMPVIGQGRGLSLNKYL